MLIYFDHSIIQFLLNPDNSILEKDTICAHLDFLAISRRDGNICLLINYDDIDEIIKCTGIGSQSRRVFKFIKNKMHMTGVLLNTVHRYVKLCILPNGQDLHIDSTANNQKIVSVDIRSIIFKQLIHKPYLLCEDVSDAPYYFFVAKHYSIDKQVPIGVNFLKEMGGGINTSRALQNILDEHEGTVLCVVDADYRTPQKVLGNTATNVLKVIHENPDSAYFADVIYFDMLEIENSIPSVILEKLNMKRADNDITMLMNLDVSLINYFDYKTGLRNSHLLQNKQYPDLAQFWMSVITQLGISIDMTKPFETVILMGYGGDVKKKCLAIIESYTRTNTQLSIDNRLLSEWKRIGQVIFDWGCAEESIYAAI